MGTTRKRLTIIITLAIVVGCAISAPSTSVLRKPFSPEEWFLFFPSTYPEGDWQPQGLVFEDLWFEAEDGTRLHAWYCPAEDPRAVVLYAHGNAGHLADRSYLLRYLQQRLSLTVLIFDYRGYGRSEGFPTVEGVLDDARAARTLLARKAGVGESDLVLMGRSLGGAVMVQLAEESRPQGLILESTFSSLKDVAAIHYPKLTWLVPSDKLDSMEHIARYDGPLLQSHGDADLTIPYALGRKLFDAARSPKQFVTISGADHNTPQDPGYYQSLDRFLHSLEE